MNQKNQLAQPKTIRTIKETAANLNGRRLDHNERYSARF